MLFSYFIIVFVSIAYGDNQMVNNLIILNNEDPTQQLWCFRGYMIHVQYYNERERFCSLLESQKLSTRGYDTCSIIPFVHKLHSFHPLQTRYLLYPKDVVFLYHLTF
ncbi:hypothetical protein GOP47_0011906, partial [Adiantum capillus-veneris]